MAGWVVSLAQLSGSLAPATAVTQLIPRVAAHTAPTGGTTLVLDRALTAMEDAAQPDAADQADGDSASRKRAIARSISGSGSPGTGTW